MLERLASGEPLRAICRDEGMPAWRTVYDWLEADKAFAARFAKARILGGDALAEQCLDIADDEQHDWVLTKKGAITNDVAIGRAKLQVWTRMQLLAKWFPQKYGDRSTVALTGENGGPVQISDAERSSKVAGLLAVAMQRKAQPESDDASDLV